MDKPMADGIALHASSVVIDAVCPLLREAPKHIDLYQKGGVDVIAPTVGGFEKADIALGHIGRWMRLLRERGDLVQIRSAADIEAAKAAGRTGVLLHFQGTDPLEEELDFIDVFKALGVGVMQLAYNKRNRVGDGCEEPSDAGLSRFGLKVVERMNKARVIIDCSHTGVRTAMQAIEASAAPVILSHANARAVHGSARNAPDELLVAVAKTGGVIGVCGYPGFVAAKARPTIDDFIAHMTYLIDLVGVDHVGLGIDYFLGQWPFLSDEEAERLYRARLASGVWQGDNYGRPPFVYPEGMETPDRLPNLTTAMLAHGISADDVQKILGRNWMRVYRQVWGA